jgi:hypothetical protein
VECREIAETQWPHALCQAHAIIFYTTVVRVGSALAELERGAPSGVLQWEQQPTWPLVDVTDLDPLPPVAAVPPPLVRWLPGPGEVNCRWSGGCLYAPKTRWGTLCAVHLHEVYVVREARLRRARELVNTGVV